MKPLSIAIYIIYDIIDENIKKPLVICLDVEYLVGVIFFILFDSNFE